LNISITRADESLVSDYYSGEQCDIMLAHLKLSIMSIMGVTISATEFDRIILGNSQNEKDI
jgi:hypothetical protein